MTSLHWCNTTTVVRVGPGVLHGTHPSYRVSNGRICTQHPSGRSPCSITRSQNKRNRELALSPTTTVAPPNQTACRLRRPNSRVRCIDNNIRINDKTIRHRTGFVRDDEGAVRALGLSGRSLLFPENSTSGVSIHPK